MNKIYKILSAALISVLIFSCSDKLLDEKLYSQLGENNLPKGPEGAEQLILGIYPKLQVNNIQGYLIYVGDAASDALFINWGGTPSTGWGGRTNFINYDANHSPIDGAYSDSYNIIAQCNEAIRLFKDEAKTNDKVKEIIAEAHFWRAFAYHWLAQTFGGVPLITDSEDLSNGILRDSHEKVIEFIISELKSIEEVLPPSRPAQEYGRVTKWAVKSLLTNVYLNQKDWANASKYAGDIINNGGFKLMENYHDVFGIDENQEVILASVAIAEHYRGNNYDALSLESDLIKALGIKGVSGSNGLGLSVPFFKTFAPNDKRRQDFDPVTKNGIMIHGYINKQDGTPLYKDTDGKPITVEQSLNRVPAMKFPLQENPVSGEWMTSDFVYMRLGEIYLAFAEAQNELGKADSAMKFINKIRTRAGLDEHPASLTKEQIRDAVLDERGWELYCEGYRRFDLIRHDRLLDKIKTKWEYYLTESYPFATAKYRYIMPIPANAMINNPLLVQNPGYVEN